MLVRFNKGKAALDVTCRVTGRADHKVLFQDMFGQLHTSHGIEKLVGFVISASGRPYPYSAVGLVLLSKQGGIGRIGPRELSPFQSERFRWMVPGVETWLKPPGLVLEPLRANKPSQTLLIFTPFRPVAEFKKRGADASLTAR